MNTLPKHIQEAATPLMDAIEKQWSAYDVEADTPTPLTYKQHARNLERIIIWQQEVTEKMANDLQFSNTLLKKVDGKMSTASEDEAVFTCLSQIEDSTQDYTQLQSYLKTLKGEK